MDHYLEQINIVVKEGDLVEFIFGEFIRVTSRTELSHDDIAVDNIAAVYRKKGLDYKCIYHKGANK